LLQVEETSTLNKKGQTMKKLFAIAIVGTMVAPISSFAATGTASFAGTITSTCVVTAGSPGRIAPNADYTTISSDTAVGGYSSQVTALATGNVFSISTDAPAGITADLKSSSYSLSGATTKATTDGTSPSPLASGLTNVAVDMSATRSNGIFTAGAYAGVVTVRCE
jgi:hypothetical protein